MCWFYHDPLELSINRAGARIRVADAKTLKNSAASAGTPVERRRSGGVSRAPLVIPSRVDLQSSRQNSGSANIAAARRLQRN
jgi:hypothetical protein